MSKTTLKVNNNGSLRIEGDFQIVDKDGSARQGLLLVINHTTVNGTIARGSASFVSNGIS